MTVVVEPSQKMWLLPLACTSPVKQDSHGYSQADSSRPFLCPANEAKERLCHLILALCLRAKEIISDATDPCDSRVKN